MTAIEEAREALSDYEKTSYLWNFEPQVVRDLAAALRALIAEAERLSAPTSDDDREALTKVLLGVHPDTVLHDWAPRVIDARQNAERVIAAGFRRQGPITDEAHPARFDRFLCADCGEPITTQRVTSTSERWVHVSDLGPGRSAVPSTTEQEKP